LDIEFIKSLIAKVENLGVVTDPLRELIAKVNNQSVNLQNYIAALTNISRIIELSGFDFNSQPIQVDMMLKQLAKRVSEDQGQVITSTPQATSESSDLLTAQILNSLMEIKGTLAGITTTQPAQQGYTPEAKPGTGIELPTVFVNPMDQEKSNSIKANVTIDSKSGGNLQGKLDRLKNLKKT